MRGFVERTNYDLGGVGQENGGEILNFNSLIFLKYLIIKKRVI